MINLEFLKLDNPALVRAFRGRAEMDARISHALAKSRFLVGDAFTAVDIVFASVGHWFRSALPAGDRVDDYIKSCTSRPAFARALAKDKPHEG